MRTSFIKCLFLASSLGPQILAIARFWCFNQKYNALEKLIYMLPRDVKGLLEGLLTISMEDGHDTILMLEIGIRWRTCLKMKA